jgi:peptidoglycan/xylan/chitin deacetylase (PgdA/CDA1 family)
LRRGLGFTIGGHTLNHRNLAELQNSVQLKYEIAEDKLRLEKIAGTKIEYFSYPFGVYHNLQIDITKVCNGKEYVAV